MMPYAIKQIHDIRALDIPPPSCMIPRMNPHYTAVVIGMVATGFALVLSAEDKTPIEGVTKSKDQLLILQGGTNAPLTTDTGLPFGVMVMTNGTFTVEKGKPRELLEGQVLRADGNLLYPDGTLTPVFNHLAMKLGKVVVVIDGQATALTGATNLADGSTLYPDGRQISANGHPSQLVDGQLIKPDGSWLPVKDTISLKNGKVIVYRDGAVYPLQSFQVMGMSDGTLVKGDGTITQLDGKKIKLTENQTILVDGVAVKRY
jgi:hypothetical protein